MIKITQCSNKKCPKFKKCKRAQSHGISDRSQSFVNFEYKNGCEFFIKVDPDQRN